MSKPLAIISGASRGIGFSIAQYLANTNKYDLYLIAKNRKKLEMAKANLCSVNPICKVFIKAVDLADEKQLDACSREILCFDEIEILVNSAGVFIPGSSTILPKNFRELISINLIAAYHLSKVVVEKMKYQGRGYIVNIGSSLGITGYEGVGAYCASKFGLVGYFDSLRKELARFGVRISTINPSYVNTEMILVFQEVADKEKIQVSDIVRVFDLILKLSDSAIIPNINVECIKFV